MANRLLVYGLIVGLLLADQFSKIWVKTHLAYGEELRILGQEWALIHFVENNGMAFGLSLGGAAGKIVLSLFRVVAVALIFVYLEMLLRTGARRSALVGFALVQAGALGNIIDSLFYGLIFSESTRLGVAAALFPAGGGYAPLGYGRVVDFLYFPLAWGKYPDWLPLVGGDIYLFFRPVFNVADVCIAVGVVLLVGRYLFGGRGLGAGATLGLKGEDGADGLA